MCVTIEKACGFLFLNEFGTFVYCCKECHTEYDTGPNLEVHVLSVHQDTKRHIESVFVNDGIVLDASISENQTNPMEAVVVLKPEANTTQTEQYSHNTYINRPKCEDDYGNDEWTNDDYDSDEFDMETIKSDENTLNVKLLKKGQKTNVGQNDNDEESDEDHWPDCSTTTQGHTTQPQPTPSTKKQKNHLCDICGKNFSYSNYITHKRTHGDKELKCRYCPKSFKLYQNRRKHEKMMHEQKWYKPKTT